MFESNFIWWLIGCWAYITVSLWVWLVWGRNVFDK